jgi:hypothetical protein
VINVTFSSDISDGCEDDVTSSPQIEYVAAMVERHEERWRRNARNKAVLRLTVDVTCGVLQYGSGEVFLLLFR